MEVCVKAMDCCCCEEWCVAVCAHLMGQLPQICEYKSKCRDLRTALKDDCLGPFVGCQASEICPSIILLIS
mgnify:CR=1 FL=1